VLSMESPLYDRVGAQLEAMGHTVKSINGADVGGFQSILFTAVPNPEKPGDTATIRPLNGFYRAGSDPRKDGQAVGW
jgi:gamma-glutamyltranspeptidase / glutathione hydrolase